MSFLTLPPLPLSPGEAFQWCHDHKLLELYIDQFCL
jgi:hypothetical protein